MPRLIDKGHCPHCGEDLPEPKPRVCPACMGSLQQRFLRAGCLSSAPPVLLFALVLAAPWADEEPGEPGKPVGRVELLAPPATQAERGPASDPDGLDHSGGTGAALAQESAAPRPATR